MRLNCAFVLFTQKWQVGLFLCVCVAQTVSCFFVCFFLLIHGCVYHCIFVGRWRWEELTIVTYVCVGKPALLSVTK